MYVPNNMNISTDMQENPLFMKNLILVLTIFSYICFLGVLGKKEALPRFIVENTVLPPIFGSYNYDPLRQVFDIEPTVINETTQHEQNKIDDQKVNQTHTQLSTKTLQFIRNRDLFRSRLFRKHVSVTTPTNAGVSVAQSKLINWWTVPKLQFRNATKAG